MPIERLLQDLTERRTAFEIDRRRDAHRSAPNFTIFGYMRPGELRLSEMLADLLDPSGTHGQGSLFLAEFLATAKLDWSFDILEAASVKVEVATFEGRRLDIVVYLPGAVLGIENKPFAADQPNQVADYLSWLDVAGRVGHRCLIYLAGAEGLLPGEGSITADRLQARSAADQFRTLSYPELLPWLERTRSHCEAERVRIFLDEFAIYIRKHFMGIRDMTELAQIVEVARQTPENLRSAMQLIAAAAEIKAVVVASLESQVRNALPEGYELKRFDASRDRYTGLIIRMPDVVDLQFTVSFEAYDFNWLIYGVTRPKGTAPICNHKAALDAEYGKGTVTEDWPWYRRAAPSEVIFPVAGDWRAAEGPWLDVQEGRFAEVIVRAAQSFREVLVRPMTEGVLNIEAIE